MFQNSFYFLSTASKQKKYLPFEVSFLNLYWVVRINTGLAKYEIKKCMHDTCLREGLKNNTFFYPHLVDKGGGGGGQWG